MCFFALFQFISFYVCFIIIALSLLLSPLLLSPQPVHRWNPFDANHLMREMKSKETGSLLSSSSRFCSSFMLCSPRGASVCACMSVCVCVGMSMSVFVYVCVRMFIFVSIC